VAGLTRREFLRSGAAGALALSLGRFTSTPGFGTATAAVAAPPDYRDWRDVWRGRWTWERVARGTHTNVNCVSSCAWNLYVKDGVVWREEQSAPYTASNGSVPDWNPRGCQKGASCSDLLLGPARILHPLRRPMAPAPGADPPEVIVSFCGNVLRHSRMGQRIRETLFDRARLIVDVNFRINETGRHADLLLPAAGASGMEPPAAGSTCDGPRSGDRVRPAAARSRALFTHPSSRQRVSPAAGGLNAPPRLSIPG